MTTGATPRQTTRGDSRLDETFFDRDVVQVAADLLGCVVTHGPVAVRLTEVEAYDGARDPGSHAFRGPTRRNATMFGRPGGLYVYFTYGMHHCANLVCRESGWGAGCLLRAGEVVEGIEVARERSRRRRTAGGGTTVSPRPVADRDLARGPARLARALGLGPEHDGCRPVESGCPVSLGPRRPGPDPVVATGPRVGVSGPGGDGAAFPWRFWIEGDPTVSVYRPAAPRTRRRPKAAGA